MIFNVLCNQFHIANVKFYGMNKLLIKVIFINRIIDHTVRDKLIKFDLNNKLKLLLIKKDF